MKDLFEFTYDIHRLLRNRVRNYSTQQWDDHSWADLCGKMNKLFRRLDREIRPTEWGTKGSTQEYLESCRQELPWADLNGLLNHLCSDMYYYSDRWNYSRAQRTQMVWGRILELKLGQQP